MWYHFSAGVTFLIWTTLITNDFSNLVEIVQQTFYSESGIQDYRPCYVFLKKAAS